MSAKEPICPQCGKKFTVMSPRDWAYRDGYTYYCSWKCIREHDAKIPPHKQNPAPKPGPLTPEQMERFETGDAALRETLQRNCRVKPSEERREGKAKRVVRARSTDDEKKHMVTECWRLMNAECLTMGEASQRLGVSMSTMGNWFVRYWDELNIGRISHADCGRRSWSARPDRPRATPKQPRENRSGEKIKRIMDTMARIRAGLDEISEEVHKYA